MIYIYDILLNFCDNDMLYDFYEWDKDDNIENIKRIKLIHIDKKSLDDLLNYNIKIDESYLLKIYRTCEVYCGKKAKVLDYCSLFSDGDRVVAIEFDKEGNSIYKSKLLMDEEDEIALLASNLEKTNIKYTKNKKVLIERFLTRNETTVRKYLSLEIIDAYKNKKYDKLRYLYQEYFDKIIDSNKKMRDDLLSSINNIDSKHKELFNLLKLTHKNKQI